MLKQDTIDKIALGIFALNKDYPGWYNKINVAKLDMEHRECCVLGQVFGSYIDAPYNLNHRVAFGFSGRTSYQENQVEFNNYWKNRIIELQNKRSNNTSSNQNTSSDQFSIEELYQLRNILNDHCKNTYLELKLKIANMIISKMKG